MLKMNATLSLRYMLKENLDRAMDNKPPLSTSVLTTLVESCKITAMNEMDAMGAALRIKQELFNAYVKAHGLYSKPCITVAVFKEVDAIEKNSWQVIAREASRVG